MAPIIAGGREVGPALGQAAEGFQPGGILGADGGAIGQSLLGRRRQGQRGGHQGGQGDMAQGYHGESLVG